MPGMRQEVKIKKDLDVPRLRGRLRPIFFMPIRKLVKPFVKEYLPLYIDPMPLKPVIMQAVEPPLRDLIEPVIPEYIGTEDEQPETIYKAPVNEPPANKSREVTPAFEDTPRAL